MSYRLRLFLRSPQPLTRGAIARFIADGVFFNGMVSFDPAAHTGEIEKTDWERLAIQYADGKRPIVAERIVDPERLSGEVSDLAGLLDDAPASETATRIARRIADTRQVVTFDVARGELPDEAWHMLDSLEAWIARSHDGVIWAEGDGLFDQNLQRVLKLS